tara:strand:- start:167 stop:400 length:234 start_codon:yes stop_codon:yes gene_type:complete
VGKASFEPTLEAVYLLYVKAFPVAFVFVARIIAAFDEVFLSVIAIIGGVDDVSKPPDGTIVIRLLFLPPAVKSQSAA